MKILINYLFLKAFGKIGDPDDLNSDDWSYTVLSYLLSIYYKRYLYLQ